MAKLTSLKIIFYHYQHIELASLFKYVFFYESASDPFTRDETCLSYSDQGVLSICGTKQIPTGAVRSHNGNYNVSIPHYQGVGIVQLQRLEGKIIESVED